jgi:hypothetical protein
VVPLKPRTGFIRCCRKLTQSHSQPQPAHTRFRKRIVSRESALRESTHASMPMLPCPRHHLRDAQARAIHSTVCASARCLLQHSAPAPPSAVGTLLSALYTHSRLRTKDPGGTYLHTLLNRSHPTLSTQPELHRRVVWDCVLHGHRGGAEGPMRGLALPTTGPPPSHSLPSSTHS